MIERSKTILRIKGFRSYKENTISAHSAQVKLACGALSSMNRTESCCRLTDGDDLKLPVARQASVKQLDLWLGYA